MIREVKARFGHLGWMELCLISLTRREEEEEEEEEEATTEG